jgi:hypothetical protein
MTIVASLNKNEESFRIRIADKFCAIKTKPSDQNIFFALNLSSSSSQNSDGFRMAEICLRSQNQCEIGQWFSRARYVMTAKKHEIRTERGKNIFF